MSELSAMKTTSRPSAIRLLLAVALPIILLGLFNGLAAAGALPPVLDLNGAALGVDFSATFTEDEGAKAIVSPTDLQIDNGDDTLLTGATATLTNRPDATAETLAADAGATGLSVKYNEENGALTVKGSGTVDSYEQVLRTLTYNNTSQSPDVADRIVLVTVSDGALTSGPVTSTVAINAVNDAPVLDNSGNMTLSAIDEDVQNSGGNSVTSIIKSAEAMGEDRITDADTGALEGFVVIEASSANGAWEYSINSGISWQAFGIVSNTSGVLLDGAARIRFVPNPGFSGSGGLLVRAWDQSGGRPTGTTGVDASLNGGITPFSAATEMVTINVLSVNDLPLVDLNGPEEGTGFAPFFFEGGPAVPIADMDATIADADHATLASLVVTLTNRPNGAAESLAAATTGTNITAAPYDPATGRLVLTGPDEVADFQQVLRTVVYANSAANPSLTARVVTLVANDGTNDGPAATSTIAINPTNNAPVLNGAAIPALAAIAEDTTQPPGQRIDAILSAAGDPITDADSGSLEGLAVIGAANGNGVWQYSLVDPPASEADWLPVGAVAETAALLLPDSARLRFVPKADYYGPAGLLTFRAWDRTTGSSGQRDVDVSVNGGNSAFSAATNVVSAAVTPVNDPPAVGGLPVAPSLYVEDAEPLNLTGGALTVTDVDSPLLAGATVRLLDPPDGDAEWMLVNTSGTPIDAAYADGVLELAGAAAPAVYQQVLRTVKYWNASQDPDPAERVFQITVADNQAISAAGSVYVQVQPVNDPPELDLDGIGPNLDYETTFYINRGPVPVVAQSLVVFDIDNTTLKSATIRIVNLENKQAEFLAADLDGVSNIKQTYDPAMGVLSLVGADSVSNYQRVLRTITYDNILPQPNTETRIIEFTLTDGVTAGVARQTLVSLVEAANVQLYLPMVTWAYRRAEEPNDICSEAMGLGLNVDEQFRAEDKDDWFFFDLTTAADVTVELHDFAPRAGQIIVAGGGGCGSLSLIGNNGSSQEDKIVDIGPQSAGRYYIWIINDGPQSADTIYRLQVRATAP